MTTGPGGWDPFNNKTTLADDGRAEKNRTQFLAINDSYILRATTILDIRASFSRFRDERIPLSFEQDLTALGFARSLAAAVQWKHIPNIHRDVGRVVPPGTQGHLGSGEGRDCLEEGGRNSTWE